MPYEFLEDVAIADIAFRAWGKDLEETFGAAAEATMNVMVENLDAIEPVQERAIEAVQEAADLLLFDFLQELIYYKDSERLLLRVKNIRIDKDDLGYRLRARARGEVIDPERHQLRVDVKAVTLHQFRLEQTRDGWEAQVILDI